jgi:hypothetical protein
MSVGPGREVFLPGVGTIPETCTLHARLGIDCPGCGLTRSFIHLAHGDLRAAWSLNPVGLLMFAFVAAQIPLVISLLWCNRARGNFVHSGSESASPMRESEPQTHAQPSCEEVPSSTPPLVVSRSSATETTALVWLARWSQGNQWILVGLMLLLLVQWVGKLIMGGLMG